ncbi:MAG: hypothetical protein ABIN61_05785 [candidate division WOR-3 bacterium]
MIDEEKSSLERKIEEESKFAEILKSKFGRKLYLDFLKGLLLKVFDPSEIKFLMDKEFLIYLVFSEENQKQLQKGLKTMKSFLSEGEKEYLTSQLNEFTQTLGKIFEDGVKAGIPPVLIELALKRWLKKQIPLGTPSLFYKKVNLSLRFFTKRELNKVKIGKRILDVLEDVLPIPVSLNEVNLDHFSEFIEDGDFFSNVLRIFADYFITQPKLEVPRFDCEELKEKIKNTQALVKGEAKNRIVALLGKIDSLSDVEIYDEIEEIAKYIKAGESKVRVFKNQLFKMMELSQAEEIKLPPILRYFDYSLTKKVQDNINTSVSLLVNKLDKVPSSFLSQGFLGRKPNYEGIIDWFVKNYDELFIPTILELIFEEVIKIFPESENDSLEEARWVGLLARKEDPFNVYFIPEIERVPSEKERLIRDYLEVVSVMVYDIRGSSIMGEKLMNAEMEDRIRNEFQLELSKAVEETGGFFVKDTGDGGIVLFSEESRDLYFRQISSSKSEKKGLDSSKLELKASPDAAVRAIRCASRMLEYSEGFVRKNLKRYKEWFREFEEKKLDFGGITYEKLPPEYRKIFQIGIGIASGKPNEEVFLGVNILGQLDLTGNLVRRAHIYSTVHHPDRSVILVETSTMCNFLLQVESFKPLEEGERIGDDYSLPTEQLREEIIRWMKGIPGGYFIDAYKVALKRIDYLLDEKGNVGKVEVPEASIGIRKERPFYDTKTMEERVLYEIIPVKRG